MRGGRIFSTDVDKESISKCYLHPFKVHIFAIFMSQTNIFLIPQKLQFAPQDSPPQPYDLDTIGRYTIYGTTLAGPMLTVW